MKSLKISASLNKIRISGGESEISKQDVVRSYLGLLVTGRTNYFDGDMMKFHEAWGEECKVLFRFDSGNDSAENILVFKVVERR